MKKITNLTNNIPDASAEDGPPYVVGNYEDENNLELQPLSILQIFFALL
jgi:hypothetical protein